MKGMNEQGWMEIDEGYAIETIVKKIEEFHEW